MKSEPEELVPNQNFAIAAYPGVAQHISSMVRPRKLTRPRHRPETDEWCSCVVMARLMVRLMAWVCAWPPDAIMTHSSR